MPQATGEGGGPGSSGFRRPWAIPLVTFGGALASAWLVAKFAPEAEGHGTDSAIDAVHTDPLIVPRVNPVDAYGTGEKVPAASG